jgi:cytochrome c oxidase assembly protein Cox11
VKTITLSYTMFPISKVDSAVTGSIDTDNEPTTNTEENLGG